MGEIKIDWNYVAAKPETVKGDKGEVSDADRLKQTQKVLEEEVRASQSCIEPGIHLAASKPHPCKHLLIENKSDLYGSQRRLGASSCPKRCPAPR